MTGAVVASNATGSGGFDAANYDITFVNGNLEVTPAALTITADDQSKIYGDTFVFSGTEFTASPTQNSETVTAVALASAGSPARP